MEGFLPSIFITFGFALINFMERKKTSKTLTEVILLLYSFIFINVGLLLLIFTKEVSLITMFGEGAVVANIIQQFLGSSYLLLGLLMYAIKGLKGKKIYFIISALNLVGFINLYLIFSFSQHIVLPSVYFIFQVLMQISLLFALIEQVKKN
jgi:hypothetical protein